MPFTRALSSYKNGAATEYAINEAYEAFPEEKVELDDVNVKEWHEDDEGDDSDASSDIDSAYQTADTASSDRAEILKARANTKKIKQKNKWDVFRETSEDNLSSTDISFWNRIFVVTKVIFSAILFVFVIGSGVISKSTLFIIISNILPPSSFRNSSLKTAGHHFQYYTQDTGITWVWSLVLVAIAPYFFNVFLSLWRLAFKKTRPLEYKPLLVALLVETLHSVGMNILIFAVLPSIDPVSGALVCMNVVVIPSALGLIYSGIQPDGSPPAQQHRVIYTVFRALALLTGLLATALWAYNVYRLDSDFVKDQPAILILFLIAPILVSVSWWENFVPQGDRNSSGLRKLKRQLRSRRTKVSAIVNFWKIVVTVAMVTMIFGVDCSEGLTCLETLFDLTNNSTLWSDTFGHTNLVVNIPVGTCTRFMPLLVAAVNIVASITCYRTCVSACKILTQIQSFSLPLVLTTPLTVALMLGVYAMEDLSMTDGCYLPFPRWEGDVEFEWSMILASVLSCIAIVFITTYVWTPVKERMQREDKLFVQPLYCGILLDQGLLLNKRKDVVEDMKGVDEKEKITELPIPENLDEWQPGEDDWSPLRTEQTPFIYLCATMWHETELEMTQILKSLFRMDEDQCARRNLQLFFGIRDPDYYEFEAHIFFDDAFDYDGDKPKANGYVKQLIRTIDVAISSVHAFGMKIPPPVKLETPYGGRLIWRLPGGNKMIAHLKDKAKIRHRKRWSQVMYMYYFLAHKLLSMGGSKDKIKSIADNTFLLALDGDVDFQPSALRLLVDRMKRNPNVGAACGRIHPIGSGPMVWYQKFEYAISHWLQKATEHTIGCVLCSPGCFSLFRGSSVMDDNVMRRYTTPPTEPRHYVQYDQGEDRWLCTLLLQQGYRVEYCAASDALTYAPEGFYEFYNQRRRWTPSTMANILDLLMDFKNVTKRNNDISMIYIAYQMLLMISSILTPGTIFLLVLGAINMAYPSLSLYWALILNLVPVVGFIMLCYMTKSSTQLAYAAVLSTVYSLVMMLVTVGLIQQAADNGFCSVTTVFLCGMAGIFLVSALIHPQEFWCIIHGFLYFLAIPSMSMLLMLYSLCNLHVVSWGTRETAKPAAAQKPGEAASKQPEKKSQVNDWLQKLGFAESIGSSDYMFSFGNLFRCVCCPKESKEREDIKLRAILDRLDDMEAKLFDPPVSHVTGMELSSQNEADHVTFSQASDLFEGTTDRENPLFEDDEPSQTPPARPWIHDPDLMDGETEKLKPEEVEFWDEMIDTYLYPLEGDKKEQAKTLEQLIELRNTVCLFFLLINALFVTIVFSLQQANADSGGSISIELPCSDGSYGEAVEPISMAFTAVFGILLVVQFFCMILHRMSTFLHICSITEIRTPRQLQPKEQEMTVEKGLQLVRDMQGAKDDDTKSVISEDASLSEEVTDPIATLEGQTKKDLWSKLARRRREQRHGTLSQNFMRNFKKLQMHMAEEQDSIEVPGTTRPGHMAVISEDGDQVDVQELKSVKRKFNRFERKSIFTIVKISRDQRLKNAILQRGNIVASRWKRAALKVKLKRHAESVAADGPDGAEDRTKFRVNFLDVARLAVADRDSNCPSEEDEDPEEIKTQL